MKKIFYITVIVLTLFVTFGCGGGDDPVTPSTQFNQVSNYYNIPQDFSLTYEIRDEYASTPYRTVLVFTRAGTLNYVKHEDTSGGLKTTTESAMLSHDEILSLYNYLVEKGYFQMAALYTECNILVPTEVIDVTAKNMEIRVEYHTCPDSCGNITPLPVQFNQIIDYLFNLAEDYLDNI